MGDQKIAVVDYSKTMREGLVAKLQANYPNVQAYETGEDLLRILEKTDKAEHPQLVLLASDMPALSGIQTCRELRNRYGKIPKIYGMISQKLNAPFFLAAGADGTINRAKLAREDDYLLSEVKQALRE